MDVGGAAHFAAHWLGCLSTKALWVELEKAIGEAAVGIADGPSHLFFLPGNMVAAIFGDSPPEKSVKFQSCTFNQKDC